ncbi:MAG: serine--tRNA ligase [Candidatus Pacebacteria bacterium]|nr:serine--tRNA ligase [Candidatus Paceibacterota bacterium]
MHDIIKIRSHPDDFDVGLNRRNLPPMASDILSLDQRRREAQTLLETKLQRRNEASKQIGTLKAKGEDASDLMAEVSEIKSAIPEWEATEAALAQQLEQQLSTIPNLPAPEVPNGKNESDNREVRSHGTIGLNDQAREHYTIGEDLGMMDFEAAAKLSGSRFVVLRGDLARLERAIASFMLDLHTSEFGYTEHQVPLLVRDQTMYGTGQLPKFAEDLFHTTDGFWLIPTAEVSLTNLVADTILTEEQLPLRMTAWTPCFRSEAGAAGKDTRGLIRQHQFSKVELVSITHPDQSDAEHERMTDAAETVLKRLELPYRTLMLCTGDMGFSARKTYDIEVWLPGQKTYREISSCSNCGDFQARRMKARFRPHSHDGSKSETRFVHTLNGSGLAVGRTMVAILENYQQADGTVAIPTVLQPFMGGRKIITSLKSQDMKS